MASPCTAYQHKNTRYSTELTPVSPHSEHHHCYTICVEFFVTGTIRIGGALVLGILIVLVSLRVSAKGDDSSSEDTLALTAPARTYIESQDSDGDGVKDWEEVLQERFIDSVSATSSENLGFNTTEEYVPPTTLTGKFSEAFFQDYLDGKVQGVDYSDPLSLLPMPSGRLRKMLRAGHTPELISR
jgi:hypothetical protein